MIHLPGSLAAQDFGAPQDDCLRRPEQIIDPAIINSRVTGFSREIPKVLQRVAVCFAIVFHVVSVEM